MCVPAEVARGSGVFLVDDRAQFDANRHDAVFAGYPEPDASIGEALLGKAPARRPQGPTFVSHLGVGLADVVFADAIVREAERLGIGTTLPG
jgi:ornithine cyclodeaminase/alanine dehydrogenase-like protein (mu-crystallin family)